MTFIIACIAFAVLALIAPRLFKLVEALLVAPLIGCAFGFFAWVACLIVFGGPMSWGGVAVFFVAGTVLAEIVLKRAS